MTRRFPILLLAVLTLSPAAAGSLLAAPKADLFRLVLDSEQVLASAQGGDFHLTLFGVDYAFSVQPNPIALGAVIGVDGVPVGHVSKTVTFSGTANGLPALVAATGAGVVIAILGPDPIFVEPVWWSTAAAPLDLHRVLVWSQNPPIIPNHPDPGPAAPMSNPAFDATEVVVPRNRTVQILVENDYAFYDKFAQGGKCGLCWVEVQQAVMMMAEFAFRRDAHVRFNVTSQWACSTPTACPYEDTGGVVDLNNWNAAFDDRWTEITTEPAHQVGHLLIGTDLDGSGGISYGGACTGCLGDHGYGVSEFGTGENGVNALTQYFTATHEIGHNFNGTHSHAAPIPPALGFVPPAGRERVWTVMQPAEPLTLQFSDGTYSPSKNNLARILAHAAEMLPA